MRTRILWAALWLLPAALSAQPTWHESPASSQARLELLHAIIMADLPTTETLERGDFHYEISHRFHPPIKEGYDANYGLDGPASMRTSLSYGLRDRLMLTLGRSNVLDNLDLQVRYRWLERRDPVAPAALAFNAGVAWSTEIPAIVHRNRLAADNFQYYVQAIGNATLLHGKLGLGLVPSYLYNSTLFSVKRQYTLTLGTYAQYYLNDTWGIWTEYSPALSGYQGVLAPGETGRSHDSLALGLSIETGGHVFYLFITNNTRLNPAQYLVGAPSSAGPSHWRVAFGITRYL